MERTKMLYEGYMTGVEECNGQVFIYAFNDYGWVPLSVGKYIAKAFKTSVERGYKLLDCIFENISY